MKSLKLILACCTFLCFSCGYFSSGTWEDEDKNWERAYNQKLPKTINLVHSWYWRSPHWSLEQAFFFEIEFNEDVKNQFLKYSDIVSIDSSGYSKLMIFNGKPAWFIPKSFQHYNIWKSNIEFDKFILFIDKKTKHIYWTEYQL